MDKLTESVASLLCKSFSIDCQSMTFTGVDRPESDGLGRTVMVQAPLRIKDSEVLLKCTEISLAVRDIIEAEFGIFFNVDDYQHSRGYHRWDMFPASSELLDKRPVMHISFRTWPSGQREVSVNLWR